MKKNDFAKYGSGKQQTFLQRIMHYVAENIGRKVKFIMLLRLEYPFD